MTIVVSWLNKEIENHPTFWVVSDSKLTRPLNTIPQPLIEVAAKIFPLHIICRKPGKEGFLSNVYFHSDIGMAFSGSSLIAFNLFSFLNYTLSNLCYENNTAIPSLAGVALHAKCILNKILQNYIDMNCTNTPCKIIIFGFCYKEAKYKLFEIKQKDLETVPGFELILKDIHDIYDDYYCHLMGEKTHEIDEIIKNYRETLPKDKNDNPIKNISWWRAPINSTKKIIQANQFSTIGGEIQIAICNPGMRLMASFLQQGEKIKFVYQNIDVYEENALFQIDNCLVHVEAMLT